MAQESKSRKLDQYIVRFPDGLRDRIKEAAAKNNRSMNAEIVYRLEESFAPNAVHLPLGLYGFIRSRVGEKHVQDEIIAVLEKKYPVQSFSLAGIANYEIEIKNETNDLQRARLIGEANDLLEKGGSQIRFRWVKTAEGGKLILEPAF